MGISQSFRAPALLSLQTRPNPSSISQSFLNLPTLPTSPSIILSLTVFCARTTQFSFYKPAPLQPTPQISPPLSLSSVISTLYFVHKHQALLLTFLELFARFSHSSSTLLASHSLELFARFSLPRALCSFLTPSSSLLASHIPPALCSLLTPSSSLLPSHSLDLFARFSHSSSSLLASHSLQLFARFSHSSSSLLASHSLELFACFSLPRALCSLLTFLELFARFSHSLLVSLPQWPLTSPSP